jgi:hypothetical protein
LKFSGSTAFMVVDVWLPKAIPHFLFTPVIFEAYVDALLKAYLYKNVRWFVCKIDALITNWATSEKACFCTHVNSRRPSKI